VLVLVLAARGGGRVGVACVCVCVCVCKYVEIEQIDWMKNVLCLILTSCEDVRGRRSDGAVVHGTIIAAHACSLCEGVQV
jgi:hypothetical protein